MKITTFATSLVLILGVSAVAFWYLPTPHHSGPASPVKPVNVDHLRATQLAHSAHDLLDSKLEDYPSARFKDVHAIHYYLGARGFEVEDNKHKRRTTEINSYALCGLVNSKNAFGAYAGWMPFAVYEGAVHIDYGTDANETYEVASICTGRGDGAERALRSIIASKQIIAAIQYFHPPVIEVSGVTRNYSKTDEAQLARESQSAHDAQERLKQNNFPMLPHISDTKTDYSKEISFSPVKSGASASTP
jgi:hypothetical protein